VIEAEIKRREEWVRIEVQTKAKVEHDEGGG